LCKRRTYVEETVERTSSAEPGRHRPRIGLVLGAGGPVGHAYHAGVLRALAGTLGWDARDAEVVLGTSAGAQVGALLRAGMHADDLAARTGDGELSEGGKAIAQHYTRGSRRPDPSRPRRLTPSAPRYLRGLLSRPWTMRPGRFVSAMLPTGRVCTRVQADGLRQLFGERWPARKLWITAVHLDSGAAVVFGQRSAPRTDVGTAVTCSGAVPGVCVPVEVGGKRYVDGGIASATHLDELADPKMTDGALDAVIVSSPLSMFAPMRALLHAELWRLRKRGTPVIAFEPRGSALRAMGLNPMAVERSADVARQAYETTRRDLDRPRTRLLRRLL
jgi:NTE family protein